MDGLKVDHPHLTHQTVYIVAGSKRGKRSAVLTTGNFLSNQNHLGLHGIHQGDDEEEENVREEGEE